MDTKRSLQKIIDDLKTKKFRDNEAKSLISSIQEEQIKSLRPVLEAISKEGSQKMIESFQSAIKAVNINVPESIPPDIKVNIPDIYVPEFPKIPQPIVNYTPPDIHIPEIKMPKEMEVKGWVNLQGFDKNFKLNPLPVELRDVDGKPLKLIEALMELAKMRGGGGGGSMGSGKIDYFTILGIQQSVAAALVDSSGQAFSGSNPLPVTITAGAGATSASNIVDSTGVAYEGSNPFPTYQVNQPTFTQAVVLEDSTGVQYSGSNPIPTTIVSSPTASVNASLIDSGGVGYSGSNPLPVTLSGESITLDQTTDSIAQRQVSGAVDSVFVVGPIAQGDSSSALRTIQAGDSVASVYVNNPVDNGDSVTALRVVIAGNSAASVSASQVGSWGVQVQDGQASTISSHQFNTDFRGLDVYVGGIFVTVGVAFVDSGGVAYSGSNPIPITIITSATATVNAVLVDSGGVGYNGANPVPVSASLSGSLTSAVVVGDIPSDTADTGSAPIKIGGIARQTNPTAVADNDRVSNTYDDLGRQVIRPLQVRDLIATAYATFATGTEATLLAGSAGIYLDLIYILASNNSTAAVGIDIRPSTAGSIVMHLDIPANGVVGVSLPVPIPQQATGDGTGGSWTVDLPDITGTTVSVSALFTKEV